jgi:hypothetical protein
MKKLFLTLVFAFAGIFAANAQVWIGGSTSATMNKDLTRFSVAPEVGYCIPNTNWTVAVGANYGFRDEKLVGDIHSVTHSLILSPYVRYSICNIEKFALFMDLTGDIATANLEGYRVGLQPGIAWMATEHWTAAFRFAFVGYNKCAFYGDEGFRLDFATSAPGFGLYYNF